MLLNTVLQKRFFFCNHSNTITYNSNALPNPGWGYVLGFGDVCLVHPRVFSGVITNNTYPGSGILGQPT